MQQDRFTNAQGVDIHTRQWLPHAKPRGGLLVVHGLGEHCGRYGPFAEHFVAGGFAVFGLDHTGHGQSGGRRAHVRDFSHFVDTLGQYVDRVRDANPRLPLFLYGHSMGGLISVHFLAAHQAQFRGAILSASAVSIPSHVSAATVLLARLLSRLAPTLRLERLDASLISRDSAVVEAYQADPLVNHGKITARLAAQIMAAMQTVGSAAGRIRLPTLLMNGTADALVDSQDTPRLHALLPDDIDKTLKQYPGLFHEIHNEPERDQVLADIDQWLRGRSPREAGR